VSDIFDNNGICDDVFILNYDDLVELYMKYFKHNASMRALKQKILWL